MALLAVLKAGAAYVPLDPAYPASRLRFMLDDSATPLVITTAALLEATSGVMPADRRVTVVRIDADAAAIAARDRTTPAVDLAPGDLAYVIYTSGSTGTPKGVQISHGALANYTAVARAAFKLEPSDRVLQFASISFDTAAEEIYPCLAAGASLVLRTDAMIHSVPEFLGTCREQGITVLDLPTAYWHELANDVERHDAALPASVRLVILGGERARPDVARAWQARFGRRVRLLNTYGPTEATIVTTMIDVPADAFDVDLQDVSIGRAIPRARVYILDRHLRPATIGAPGELCIGGAGLARGYLNRPDLTADRFVPDPFAADPGGRLYRTGDLARYLGDGTIEFLGRIDQQIKLRGHRIELTEIETALTDDAAVQDAVVVLRDEGTAGARLAAYVVARGASLSTSELRQRLRDRLPEYMIPSAFVRLESLPLTPSGKIDRDALPAPQIDRPSSEPYAAPQTELQNTLASLWRDLLAVDRVGIDDNFFDLGGHSLLVLQLHSRLRALFHDAPSVVDLFRFSTVRLLAAHLAAGQNDDSSAAASSDLARERASRQREAFRRRREAAQAGVAEAVE